MIGEGDLDRRGGFNRKGGVSIGKRGQEERRGLGKTGIVLIEVGFGRREGLRRRGQVSKGEEGSHWGHLNQ